VADEPGDGVIVSVDLNSAVPPYEQLRAQIADMAASGVLTTGTRLPTIRQLAMDLGLAPGTVSRAYRELEVSGVVVARGRHGTFITDRPMLPPSARRARLVEAAEVYARAVEQLGITHEEAVRTLSAMLDA
jgi:DNA-binding transcriptional regulator YhcF (GntR family)